MGVVTKIVQSSDAWYDTDVDQDYAYVDWFWVERASTKAPVVECLMLYDKIL